MAWLCLSLAIPAHGQIVETMGSPALGMGGAFVAVASDGTASWWNPAGFAAGPFVDIAWGRNLTEADRRTPAWRHRSSWVTLGAPPIGFSHYRFRITDIGTFGPTETTSDDRQDGRVGVPLRTLSASQWGVTLVQTISQGVHVGTTLKYLRGAVDVGHDDGVSGLGDRLDAGEGLDGGMTESRFDLDVGVLGVAGPIRIGGVVRNVREPEFGSAAFVPDLPTTRLTLPRQVRVGVAFAAEEMSDMPLTVALDGDLRAYDTATGARQVVALGAERWFLGKRFALRAGGRLNTRAARERAATVGMSVATRGGLLLEGHAVGGGDRGEQGWGVTARVSY